MKDKLALGAMLLSGFRNTQVFKKLEPEFKWKFRKLNKIIDKIENSNDYFGYIVYNRSDVRWAYEAMLYIIEKAPSHCKMKDDEAEELKDLHELLSILQFLVDPKTADEKLPPLRYKDNKADAIALFFNSFFTNDTKIVFRKFEEVKDEYQD